MLTFFVTSNSKKCYMSFKRYIGIAAFLFFAIKLQAQQFTISQIKEAYTKRLDNTPKEFTYIHTDREIYIAGEELLFKVYLISYPFIDTNAISKVCYVYLCNAAGKIVQTQVLKVKDKSAYGVLAIPKTMDNGEYYFVATTMWMQNFNNNTSHFKKISILKSIAEKAQKPAKKAKDIEVGFFAESGNLINGVNQKIGVRSLNENGASIDVLVNIKNSKNVILQTFNTGALGLTTFTLNAEDNDVYTAECMYKKENITKKISLPIASNTTPTLTINNQKKIFIQLNVPQKLNNEKYFIVGSTNGNLIFAEEFDSSKSEKLVAISKSNLPAGILVLHLINSKAQIIAQRFVWVGNDNGFIQPKLSFIKAINKKKREKGEVSIDFLKNIDANISISVSRKNWSDTNQLNIFQYMQMLAALGNSIDFTKTSLQQILNDKNSVDDFLIVNGWRKFSPINILVDEPVNYTNENGIYVAGKITKAQSKTIVPNSKLDLIVLNTDSSKYIYSEPTNKNGEFIFRDMSISKNSNIFYSATNLLKGNALVDVSFYKHFTDTLKSFNLPKADVDIEKPTVLYLDSLENNKFKYLQEVRVVSKRTTEIEKFDQEYVSALFENADQNIILKNEPTTSTIWQILQRNVSGITIANTDTGRIVYFNRYFGVDAFSENGLGTVQFFLNEQPVSQFEIEGVSPDDIAYIKVYKGGLGYVLGAPRGGIAFYTIKGKKTSDWRDKGFTKFEVKGYEPEYKIYNMQYSNTNIANTDLDYRPTIYWMPTKIIKNQQKTTITYFSDDKENCQWVLKINGFTTDNTPIFAQEIIE
jgi:hypothetical protein